MGLERQGRDRRGRAAGLADRIVYRDVAITATRCRSVADARGRGIGGIDGDVRRVQRRRDGGASGVAAGCRNHHIVRVDQPLARGACGRQGADNEIAGQIDGGCAGFDKAAISAMGCTGIELATHLNAVMRHGAQEGNLSLFTCRQGLGFYQAGVVDDGTGQVAGRFGAQIDKPAIGHDGPAVLDQGIDDALFHLQLDRATQIQGELAASADEDIACRRRELAVVGDLGCDQRNAAALGGGYAALVDDGIAAGTLEQVVTGQEIFGAHMERGRHKPAHIHLCARAEQHAVRVDKEHLAVGFERTLDDGNIRAQHPIQGYRAGRRLNEADAIALTDGEALPVNGHLAGGLVDSHDRTVLDDGAAAGHDTSARR